MPRQQRGFWVGLIAMWLFALALRFWGLDRFNTLVFDEVYFAQFGHNYLTQTPFFDAQPPLGKYMIALGIWLQGFNPWGYRWINALMGSLIPLILAGIAYQLTQRPRYALIAGGLATLDGLLLVESRYALINLYLVLFGLLGNWFVLLALGTQGKARWLWLSLAALGFGASASVKWNGLGFLLGLYLLWLAAWVLSQLGVWSQNGPSPQTALGPEKRLPLQRILHLTPLQLVGLIPAIAAVVYCLIWIPHLRQNPIHNLWQVHQEILSYHQQLGTGPDVHPYCSPWYTWPLMLRPISYFYQQATDLAEPIPITGPPLPTNATKFVYSVYGTGNPILWWLTTVAILYIFWRLADQIIQVVAHRRSRSFQSVLRFDPEQVGVPLYLGVNYAANFLPWAGVSRCVFLYHYLPALMFSGLAIAWLIDRWLHSPHKVWRAIGVTLIFVSLISFVFWLPFYLGLPLTPQAWQLRIWLPTWI